MTLCKKVPHSKCMWKKNTGVYLCMGLHMPNFKWHIVHAPANIAKLLKRSKMMLLLWFFLPSSSSSFSVWVQSGEEYIILNIPPHVCHECCAAPAYGTVAVRFDNCGALPDTYSLYTKYVLFCYWTFFSHFSIHWKMWHEYFSAWLYMNCCCCAAFPRHMHK